MALQITPEKVMLLKRIVSQHLQGQDVQSTLLAHVTESVSAGHKTKEQVAAESKSQPVVEKVLHALGGSAALASAIKPHLRPDHRTYVHLQVLGGRAFLDHLHHQDKGSRDGQVYLSLSFREQRFTSSRVRCDIDPAFDGSFLLELGLQLETDLHHLLDVTERVHIVALRRTADGKRTAIGSCSLDWRQVLSVGHVSISAELFGPDERSQFPTGILDVKLELLPQPKELLEEDIFQRQLKTERVQETEAVSRFVSYAKEWRDDFLRLRDSNRVRPIDILARAANGDLLPVCAFVQPLRSRLIGSPYEAARFVSLLGGEEGHVAEVWSDTHTFLARGYGSTDDHAVLLCSLLLGFGLDAYVCIGQDRRGRHAWILTRSNTGDVTFWESLTGRRYPQSDPVAMEDCQYRTVGCVFNHERFLANNQVEDSVRLASFDLQNGAHWIGLEEAAIASIRKLPRVALLPGSLVPHREEQRLEAQLRTLVAGYRSDRKLPVTWDDELGHLLMPALVSYENEQLLGVSVGQDNFQQSIKATVPVGHTFKAFPQNFNHRSTTTMFYSLLQEAVFRDILGTKAESIRLALRVRLFPYPEDVCSTWVMLAVTFRSKPPK